MTESEKDQRIEKLLEVLEECKTEILRLQTILKPMEGNIKRATNKELIYKNYLRTKTCKKCGKVVGFDL